MNAGRDAGRHELQTVVLGDLDEGRPQLRGAARGDVGLRRELGLVKGQKVRCSVELVVPGLGRREEIVDVTLAPKHGHEVHARAGPGRRIVRSVAEAAVEAGPEAPAVPPRACAVRVEHVAGLGSVHGHTPLWCAGADTGRNARRHGRCHEQEPSSDPAHHTAALRRMTLGSPTYTVIDGKLTST